MVRKLMLREDNLNEKCNITVTVVGARLYDDSTQDETPVIDCHKVHKQSFNSITDKAQIKKYIETIAKKECGHVAFRNGMDGILENAFFCDKNLNYVAGNDSDYIVTWVLFVYLNGEEMDAHTLCDIMQVPE